MRRRDIAGRDASAVLAAIVLAIAMASGLGACGGGGGAATSPASPPVASTPAPPAPVSAVQLDAQPASLSAAAGDSVGFSVHATGTGPLTYQWFRSGMAIPGATTSALQITAVRYADDASAYTVEVGNAAGTVRSQPAILSLKAAADPVTIDACTEITRPGSYRLGKDIGTSTIGAVCLAIHDVQGVQLDCAGHAISDGGAGGNALDLRKVSNFSIRQCAVSSFVLNMNDSDNGSFSHNTVSSIGTTIPYVTFNVVHGKSIVFDGNTIAGPLQQFYGDGNTVSNNRFLTPAMSSSIAGNVVSNWGKHDRIIGNIIDGGWSGKAGEQIGSDDGIILSDNEDALVENNTIGKVWDCGIEWLGTLTHAVIRANHIADASYCGIGGWYFVSLSDAVVADNTVEQSAAMIVITRTYGLRPAGTDFDKALPADTAVVFRNNQFTGNVFTNPIGSSGSMVFVLDFNAVPPGTSTLPGERPPSASDYQIVNNVFTDNQFPAGTDGPWFGPGPFVPGAIVDGGGNRCKPRSEPGYPIKCQ